MMTVAHRFTSADLATLPDIPGVRYEIIDGDLHVSRQPQVAHQYVADQIRTALELWNRETGVGISLTVPGLVFSEDDDVIPDVVWASQARFDAAIDDKGHFCLAPELVVEVLSPGRSNEFRDRELKLDLYSRTGVHEYWIADWQQHRVQVFRRTGGDLIEAATVGDGETLTSPLLPGFSCAVASLWLKL